MIKTIQIKCTGAALVEIESLTPLQGDLKDLSEENYKKLRKEILELGFSEPLSVWPDGDQRFLLNGHQRHRVLTRMKADGYEIPLVPVNWVQAENESEAKKKILALTSQYGEITGQGLYEFSVNAGLTPEEIRESFRFPEINPDSWEIEFFKDNEVPPGDPDQVPEHVEPRTKLGDIYQLGEHRLMCGDSTSVDDLLKLMNGNRADMLFTSPPYNLGNNAKLRGHNGDGKDSAYIEKSDHKTEQEYLDFLMAFTNNALTVCDTAFVNIQLLAGNKFVIPEYWHRNASRLIDVFIWDKEHAPPSAAERVLNSVWEFIFIFSDQDRPTRSMKHGPVFRGTVDNIYRLNPVGKKDKLAKDHGAVFPIDFADHFVQKFSDTSVLDLFGGSGTTIIACEKNGRRGYSMELDPRYCDVIIQRWQNYSGKIAHLVENDGSLTPWSEVVSR